MVPQPSVEEIENDPKLAGFTYQRQQCQRCHVGVKGREKRGDYRGMGCSSCHIPYGNEGYYEGNDPTINKEEKGHMLVHKIQGTRKTKVKHGDVEYSGIPVETCNSCHNRGKRIGVTYQGLMEFPYGSPYNAEGGKQPKLHTKKYLFISDDLHHQIESRPENPKGGLLCQDCHTTIDMHGDGNIFGTTLAQVEIECQDCHGTTDQLSRGSCRWATPRSSPRRLPKTRRGLTQRPDARDGRVRDLLRQADGYLKTARGNPFGNVVKDGNKVIMHSATGNDFEVPLLKQLAMDNTWKSPNAKVAMSKVRQAQREPGVLRLPRLLGAAVLRLPRAGQLRQGQGRQALPGHRLDRRRQPSVRDGRPDRRVAAGHPRYEEPRQGVREALLPALGRAGARHQRRRPRDPADARLPDRVHGRSTATARRWP